MTKIFITGSTDGLGYLAARKLIAEGNEVTIHARNQQRAEDVKKELPEAKHIVIGDLGNRLEVESIANQVNKIGVFDTVIYNAGVDSMNSELTFKVNVLAPYLLTALIKRPQRIIYISSGMHRGAELSINNLLETTTYSSSKLQILLLAKTLARLLPNVTVTAVDPGWVPTKMGGSMATDDLTMGYTTQVWLATLNDRSVSGGYYHHLKLEQYDQRVDNVELQKSDFNPIAGVRSKEQITEFESKGVSGRLIDVSKTVNQLARHMEGIDALVITVAGNSLINLDGKVKLVQAAKKVGINRIVLISAIGINHFHDDVRLNWMDVAEQYASDMYYADMYVINSGMNFTSIRPATLTNGPATGKGMVGDDLPNNDISRADVADAVLESLMNDNTIGKAFDLVGGDTSISKIISGVQ